MIKFPKKISDQKIKSFFKEKNLNFLLKYPEQKQMEIDKMKSQIVYAPVLSDLYRIYQFIVINKRTTVLEFGCGWSTLVMSEALKFLKKRFFKNVKKLRRNNPFELFVVDNEKKYLNNTKKNLNRFLKKNNIKTNFHFSNAKMTTFNGRIATEFKTLPNCNPDFIYLDGPDQFNIKGNINGLNINQEDFMPMTCDILKFEHFLQPGTIILCDGRKANARFLKSNFQRDWSYNEHKESDQVIFHLKEKPLGHINKKIIDFYSAV